MIAHQYTDKAGFIQIVWQMADGNGLNLKFKTQPTTEQLQQFEADYIADKNIRELLPIIINLYEHRDLLIDIIVAIKKNPTLTLTQYNNFLTTKSWGEAAAIRFFIYRLALGLAQFHGLVLSDFTESQMLVKVRNWIVSTPTKNLRKIIFNEINGDDL